MLFAWKTTWIDEVMAERGSHIQRYITGPLGQQARPRVIAFEHVSTLEYGHLALRDVSLSVHEGEALAVIGPEDAGKSELLACVEGLAQPIKGHLNVMGHPVPPMTTEIRRQIGVMPRQLDRVQAVFVADLVRRFAGYYNLDLSAAQIEAYCRHYALSASWNIAQLSPSQLRLLALALTLIHDPHLVLLDEPLSGLSNNDSLLIQQYLRRMQSEGRTLLATFMFPIAEDQLRGYDLIVMLDKGHIVSQESGKG